MRSSEKKYSIFVVPTGTGASIGGYAGDAGRYAAKIAREFPLIVNPNVVNAACFSSIDENMLYVEGFVLTEFLKGNLSLKLSSGNKIGVVFDRSISNDALNVHINTINAVKTVYGFDIIGYELTDSPVGVEFFTTDSGISSGSVKNPETLLSAGKRLLEKGADVLAIVCKFDEPDEEDGYSEGNAVDVVGGVEAIISHFVAEKLGVPAVHAPAFDDFSISPKLVHPKASAEYITPTFLPCLFFGLNNAPLIVKGFDKMYVTKCNVKSVIMPYNSLGCSLVSNAIKSGIPVIAVKENETVCNADPDILGLKTGIILADTYENVPEILRRLC